MPILDVEGRPRSIRSEDEELRILLEDINRLPDNEQRALKEVYASLLDGETDPYERLAEAEYRVAPVDIRTFLTEPYFLGETGASLWPKLLDDIVELFEGQYEEALLGGSLGWGKCLTGNNTLVDGETGERLEIWEAVDRTPLVPSLTGTELKHQRASKVWASGRKQCARLELQGGMWLEASLDHPVLAKDGYQPLGELKPKDLVAVARRVPPPERPLEVSDEEVVMVAQWLLKGTAEMRRYKRVPAKFFGLDDRQLRVFLWALLKGAVPVEGEGSRIEARFHSGDLVDDVVYLLRRFGVCASKMFLPKSLQYEPDRWVLKIEGVGNLLLFIEKVGFTLESRPWESFVEKVRNTPHKGAENIVPIGVPELEEIRLELGRPSGRAWGELARPSNPSFRMSRKRFRRLCEATGYQGRHRWLLDADDICWKRVKSVTDIGVHDVYDLSVPETQNAVVNGVVVHNSFFSTTAMAYVIYQMSCLRNPQRAYGIDLGSHIYVAMLSVTEKVAKRVVINELIGKIRHSRYFQDNFKPKEAPSQLEVRFPSNIQVVAGSTGSSALIGLNVFSGLIDESSFLGESKSLDRHGREVVVDLGESIYKSIIRRMKSRFQRVGRLPGLLIVASSKERPSAFIEKRVIQAREIDDPMVFIREYATWGVHPPEKFSGKFFKIVVGTERVASRILSGDPEEEARYRDMGLQIVEVPEDYRTEFTNDIDGALRDIAGVATDVVSQYMNRTEKVFDAQDATLAHPVGEEGTVLEEWVANSPLPIMWHRIAKPYQRRLPGGYHEEAWRPIRHPEAVRYAHIDPSYAADCAGICIAHVAGWTEVVRRDAYGEEFEELAPRIETDIVLRVVPPPGDEIMLADLRGVVYQFMSHGFQIAYVSLDSFQSIDTIQQLNKHGVEAEVVSVDKTTEPYDCLKAAMYEDRFRMPAHSVALREFRFLQRVPKAGGKIKIDHPKKNPDGTPGSKDVADAIAGVVYALTQKTPGRPIIPMLSSRETLEEKVDDSWLTGGRIPIQSAAAQGGGRGVAGGRQGGVGRGVDALASLPFLKG
jgi:hypothetical protein